MELTGIAALICAACFSCEIGDMAEVLLFSCSMGLFSALTVVAYLIAFLRHRAPQLRRWVSRALVVLCDVIRGHGILRGDFPRLAGR